VVITYWKIEKTKNKNKNSFFVTKLILILFYLAEFINKTLDFF